MFLSGFVNESKLAQFAKWVASRQHHSASKY